jgi:hypothetical protein
MLLIRNVVPRVYDVTNMKRKTIIGDNLLFVDN